MTKWRPSYFGQIMRRRDAQGRTILLASWCQQGGKRKRKSNMRLIDSVKEVMAFIWQDLSKAVNDKTFRRSLIHRVAIGQKQYNTCTHFWILLQTKAHSPISSLINPVILNSHFLFHKQRFLKAEFERPIFKVLHRRHSWITYHWNPKSEFDLHSVKDVLYCLYKAALHKAQIIHILLVHLRIRFSLQEILFLHVHIRAQSNEWGT